MKYFLKKNYNSGQLTLLDKFFVPIFKLQKNQREKLFIPKNLILLVE